MTGFYMFYVYRAVAIVVLIGVLIFGLVFYFQTHKTVIPEIVDTQIEEPVTDDSDTEEVKEPPLSEFVFQYLTAGPNSITLQDPATLNSDASDLSYYKEAVSKNENITPEAIKNDTPYLLDLGEVTYGALFMGKFPVTADTLIGMQTEVLNLTRMKSNEYKRKNPHERIPEVVELIAHPTIDTVYPNMRAAGGYFLAEFFSRINPEERALYEASGFGFAERGVAYGLYSKSDMDASKSLVEQYFKAVENTELYKERLLKMQEEL